MSTTTEERPTLGEVLGDGDMALLEGPLWRERYAVSRGAVVLVRRVEP